MIAFSTTLFADLNAILNELLAGVREILGAQFVGMYLDGSLALGEFNYDTSDIDFLVVTTDELGEDKIRALHAFHSRLAQSESKWGDELEGAYIPRDALRRHDPTNAMHPKIQRGESLRVEPFETDWVIHRCVLREHGIVVVGPPLHELIDPISPDELRRATVDLFNLWWAPMIDEPSRLRKPGYQVYAILTMCRILYTLKQGTVVSKPFAARWVQEKFGERWNALIESALAWRNGMPLDHLDETREFIRFTRAYSYA